jgi:hypothetical protein
MGLSEDELEQFRANVKFLRQDSRTGPAFINFAGKMIKRYQPDIVFADPLLAYIGGDLIKQEVASKFLRDQLNPILNKTGVAWFWIHHVGKPGSQKKGQEKTSEELKYSGLSLSELQNVAREIITLRDIGDGLFELHFGKRHRRTGIVDENGHKVRSINIRHSDHGIAWEPTEGKQVKATTASVKAMCAEKQLRAHIVKMETVTLDQLKSWASRTEGQGINRVGSMAKAFVHDDVEPKIYTYKGRVGGRGPSSTLFSTKESQGPDLETRTETGTVETGTE